MGSFGDLFWWQAAALSVYIVSDFNTLYHQERTELGSQHTS